jgi:23S rRNA (pseudouridine1915-N3)-methyltransferase
MKFIFAHLTTSSTDWSEGGVQFYLKKIAPFVKIETQEIRVKKLARDESATKKKQEAEDILKFLKPDDFLVLFDEKGKVLSSEDFAKHIQRIQNSGKQRVVFLIGGAYGVTDDIKNRSQLSVSLSSFVLNHWVAQIVALEQIYRAFTINKNLPYHNA